MEGAEGSALQEQLLCKGACGWTEQPNLLQFPEKEVFNAVYGHVSWEMGAKDVFTPKTAFWKYCLSSLFSSDTRVLK